MSRPTDLEQKRELRSWLEQFTKEWKEAASRELDSHEARVFLKAAAIATQVSILGGPGPKVSGIGARTFGEDVVLLAGKSVACETGDLALLSLTDDLIIRLMVDRMERMSLEARLGELKVRVDRLE